MPRSEDLVLQLVEVTVRMERLRAALSSRLAEGLTAEEQSALQAALASAAQEIRQLEDELRQLSERGGAK